MNEGFGIVTRAEKANGDIALNFIASPKVAGIQIEKGADIGFFKKLRKGCKGVFAIGEESCFKWAALWIGFIFYA